MSPSSTIRTSLRAASTAVSLFCAVAGTVRAGAAEQVSAEEQIRRLQAALAMKSAEASQLRSQLDNPSGRATDALPAVTPMAFGSETRRTLAIAPSSNLDHRTAQSIAESTASKVPGSCVAVVRATGSMRPLFDENALLILEPVPFSALRVGDIVTYVHPRTHELIVHRLIEKHSDGFWIKGDHNGRMDDTVVTPENYRMRVCGILYSSGNKS